MFQLAQIVGETFFEYQDVLRDSFLTAKMFVAVGGYDFFMDPRNFGTFSTLVRAYLIYKSDILQCNTVGRWNNGMIVPPFDGPNITLRLGII